MVRPERSNAVERLLVSKVPGQQRIGEDGAEGRRDHEDRGPRTARLEQDHDRRSARRGISTFVMLPLVPPPSTERIR